MKKKNGKESDINEKTRYTKTKGQEKSKLF